jgi:hypothetical protein
LLGSHRDSVQIPAIFGALGISRGRFVRVLKFCLVCPEGNERKGRERKGREGSEIFFPGLLVAQIPLMCISICWFKKEEVESYVTTYL